MLDSYSAEKFHWQRGVHYAKYGVEYTLNDHGDYLYFGSFGRLDRHLPKSEQYTKGNGRKALAELCKLADFHDQAIELYTQYPELYEYYESFGFKCIKEGDWHYRRYRREPAQRH